MDPLATGALGLGAAWASGINVYAVVLTLGLLDMAGWIDLPPQLAPLASPFVLSVAGFMYLAEFVADKIPGVDHLWDAVHTFIRIPAGAILAAASIGAVDPELAIAAAIAGGTLAAGTHFTKASTRAAVNLSPEPFSTWVASLFEDAAAVGGTVLAIVYPIAFLVALAVFVALAIWLLPKLIRFAARVLIRIVRWFRGELHPSPPDPASPP